MKVRCRRARRRGQRGSILIVVVVMAAAALASSAAVIERASQGARELRARRDALCARYAALGGLALGSATPSDGSAAALVDSRAHYLAVSLVRPTAGWCVLRSKALCDGAVRTLDRTLADTTACDAAAP